MPLKPLNYDNMKANELRIGNLVKANYKGISFICDVVKIIFNEIFAKGIMDDDKCEYEFAGDPEKYAGKENGFEPIPLTEEWLNKFGFEKESKNHWNIINPEYTTNWFYVLMKEGKYFIPYRWGKQVTGDRYMIYVHQLQNLYFALTGEELTIKNE